MSEQRRALARVNLAAIERNCARLRSELAGGCELCAVVKADGYGHGAAMSARAALAGGASRLAVAGAREAVALRQAVALKEAGIDGVPLLVMGALSPIELGEALRARAEVVVWDVEGVRAVARAGGGAVHVKLDSGMGRLGTRSPDQANAVVELAAATPGVRLAGVMTHFATADNRGDRFFEQQLRVFAQWALGVQATHPDVLVHAANSAATLRARDAHFDMVRCGIAIYGMDPFGEDPSARSLEPALELRSYVAEVKRCLPGESAGYGRRFVAERETQLGVLPIGYGDGWRRALSGNAKSSEKAEVLIEGRRRPLIGTISMDNLTIDLGEDPDAQRLKGRAAVLIGSSGQERILAEDVARLLGSINYEVTCGLTRRVQRVFHRDGHPDDTGVELDGRG